jgi:hypothetical protein
MPTWRSMTTRAILEPEEPRTQAREPLPPPAELDHVEMGVAGAIGTAKVLAFVGACLLVQRYPVFAPAVTGLLAADCAQWLVNLARAPLCAWPAEAPAAAAYVVAGAWWTLSGGSSCANPEEAGVLFLGFLAGLAVKVIPAVHSALREP